MNPSATLPVLPPRAAQYASGGSTRQDSRNTPLKTAPRFQLVTQYLAHKHALPFIIYTHDIHHGHQSICSSSVTATHPHPIALTQEGSYLSWRCEDVWWRAPAPFQFRPAGQKAPHHVLLPLRAATPVPLSVSLDRIHFRFVSLVLNSDLGELRTAEGPSRKR